MATITTPEWQWANSASMDGAYTDIEDAEAATYTPKPADKGKFLRAAVTYTDPQGSDKTAEVVSANAVLAARSANTAPVFEDERRHRDTYGNESRKGSGGEHALRVSPWETRLWPRTKRATY